MAVDEVNCAAPKQPQHDCYYTLPGLTFFLVSVPELPVNRRFGNVYEDEERARAYATLQFPGTYYLAFRDLPALIRRYNGGSRALDFGCGTGRSAAIP